MFDGTQQGHRYRQCSSSWASECLNRWQSVVWKQTPDKSGRNKRNMNTKQKIHENIEFHWSSPIDRTDRYCVSFISIGRQFDFDVMIVREKSAPFAQQLRSFGCRPNSLRTHWLAWTGLSVFLFVSFRFHFSHVIIILIIVYPESRRGRTRNIVIIMTSERKDANIVEEKPNQNE